MRYFFLWVMMYQINPMHMPPGRVPSIIDIQVASRPLSTATARTRRSSLPHRSACTRKVNKMAVSACFTVAVLVRPCSRAARARAPQARETKRTPHFPRRSWGGCVVCDAALTLAGCRCCRHPHRRPRLCRPGWRRSCTPCASTRAGWQTAGPSTPPSQTRRCSPHQRPSQCWCRRYLARR